MSGLSSSNSKRRAPPVPPRSNTASQPASVQPTLPLTPELPTRAARQSLPANLSDLSFASSNPFRTRGAAQLTSTAAPRPALPPRRPSRGPGPALPPRPEAVPSASSSSRSLRSIESVRLQPTSTAPPSRIMQQSLAAAAAASASGSPKKERAVSVSVIRTSANGSLGVGAGAGSGSGSGAPSPTRDPARTQGTSTSKPNGRTEEIRRTVTRALRQAEDDSPPAPPVRRVSARARAEPARGMSRDGAGVRRWASGDVLAERPRGAYALIVLNQPINRRDVFHRIWQSSTLRYCADGGSNRLYDVLDDTERDRFLPTMIKGDLDSIRPEVRAYYASRGVTVKQDRDEYMTDVQKCIAEVEAVERATDRKFTLVLLGGFSGRVDHTVHIMALIHKLRSQRVVYVLSDESLAWVVPEGKHDIEIDHASMGQTCGILPVGIDGATVKTSGLEWNMDGPTAFDGLVSSSNHLLPDEPVVRLETDRPLLWTVEVRPLAPARTHAHAHAPVEHGVGNGVARGAVALGMGLARRAEDVVGGLAQGKRRDDNDGEEQGLMDGYARLV
ncbi:thiamine pyrophosphokinase [Cryptotrichosporon argae]